MKAFNTRTMRGMYLNNCDIGQTSHAIGGACAAEVALTGIGAGVTTSGRGHQDLR